MNAFMYGFLDELAKTGGIKSRLKTFKKNVKREGLPFGVGLTAGFGLGAGLGVSRGKAMERKKSKDKKKK